MILEVESGRGKPLPFKEGGKKMKSVEPKTLKRSKKEIKIINAMSYMKNALSTNSKTICFIIFLLLILKLSLSFINTQFFASGGESPPPSHNTHSCHYTHLWIFTYIYWNYYLPYYLSNITLLLRGLKWLKEGKSYYLSCYLLYLPYYPSYLLYYLSHSYLSYLPYYLSYPPYYLLKLIDSFNYLGRGLGPLP
jgi:hypothetical protein